MPLTHKGTVLKILAYLEPGTGSLIIQAVLGGIAGIVVFFKAWKARIMSRRVVAAAGDTEPPTDEATVTTES